MGFAAERAIVLFAVLAVFFGAEVGVRLANCFFARLFDADDLDIADLEALRAAVLEVVALFALGRTDFVFIERLLTADFGADRRVGVRDVDRLKPLVTGLLIRKVQLERPVALQGPKERAGA